MIFEYRNDVFEICAWDVCVYLWMFFFYLFFFSFFHSVLFLNIIQLIGKHMNKNIWVYIALFNIYRIVRSSVSVHAVCEHGSITHSRPALCDATKYNERPTKTITTNWLSDVILIIMIIVILEWFAFFSNTQREKEREIEKECPHIVCVFFPYNLLLVCMHHHHITFILCSMKQYRYLTIIIMI